MSCLFSVVSVFSRQFFAGLVLLWMSFHSFANPLSQLSAEWEAELEVVTNPQEQNVKQQNLKCFSFSLRI